MGKKVPIKHTLNIREIRKLEKKIVGRDFSVSNLAGHYSETIENLENVTLSEFSPMG
jgi:hypothetical protein